MRGIARLLAVCGLVLSLGNAHAQEKKDDPKEPAQPFQTTEVGLHTCADLTFIGSMPPPPMMLPWGYVGVRLLAAREDKVPLSKWQFKFDEVLPLKEANLDKIQDGRRRPEIQYKTLKELPAPDLGFYLSLNEAIEKSNFAGQDQFERSAEEFKDRVYAQLKEMPGRYRGKIITVSGTLKRLLREDTPRLVAQRLGNEIPSIYTGLIRGPAKGTPPYTIVFLDLPLGANVGEDLDLPVTFQGYFLGMVAFPPDKQGRGKPQDIICPYLVGKTLTVHEKKKDDGKNLPPEEEDKTATSYYILAWTVGGIVLVFVLGAMLNIWFRKGDRNVQKRLADMRDKAQPFNLEPADEAPPDEETKPSGP